MYPEKIEARALLISESLCIEDALHSLRALLDIEPLLCVKIEHCVVVAGVHARRMERNYRADDRGHRRVL